MSDASATARIFSGRLSAPVIAPFSSLKPNLVAMITSLRIGANASPTSFSLT
jgi:hypothetical protein